MHFIMAIDKTHLENHETSIIEAVHVIIIDQGNKQSYSPTAKPIILLNRLLQQYKVRDTGQKL